MSTSNLATIASASLSDIELRSTSRLRASGDATVEKGETFIRLHMPTRAGTCPSLRDNYTATGQFLPQDCGSGCSVSLFM
jgi:hypothetical protein